MQYRYQNPNPTGEVRLQTTEPEAGITLLELEIRFPEPCVPKPVCISWEEPCIDICAAIRFTGAFERTLGPDWSKKRGTARFASCAPIYAWISNDSQNRLTVALSDAETPTEIAGGVVEETGAIACDVRFFTQPVAPLTVYRATIRLDRRQLRYEEVLRAADAFWVSACGYPYATVPPAAREAVYSCWYSFHQKLNGPAVLAQCRLARSLGMKTVIVDDGWQTDDNSRGYATCGDWQAAPGKIPDMRGFADAVHSLGMKLMLWYSVPFIGKESAAYERLRDRTLGSIGKNWEALDPRYPEVRSYLTGLYTEAVTRWDLDGFKLDFIDSFALNPNTKPFDPCWDTTSLEDGINRLLRGITDALRAVKPDILIEFRYSYFGPAVRRYGNMIRVGDCPDDPLRNRVHSIDMRYLTGRIPVHSDMLMWHPEDTPEAVAYQMITTLFCVPQISVALDNLSDAQRAVLSFWLTFWQKHRETLLDGTLWGDHPEALYSQVRADGAKELIAVAYTDPVLKTDLAKPAFLVNATGGDTLILQHTGAPVTCSVTVRDCAGQPVSCRELRLEAGAHAFPVPPCGLLEVSRP